MKKGGACKAPCGDVWVQVEHPGVIALKGQKGKGGRRGCRKCERLRPSMKGLCPSLREPVPAS